MLIKKFRFTYQHVIDLTKAEFKFLKLAKF